MDLQAELARKDSELQRLSYQKGSEMSSLQDQLEDSARELSRYRDNKEKEVMEIRNELMRRESELQRQIEKKEETIKILQEELEDEKHRRPRLMKVCWTSDR